MSDKINKKIFKVLLFLLVLVILYLIIAGYSPFKVREGFSSTQETNKLYYAELQQIFTEPSGTTSKKLRDVLVSASNY